MYGANQCIEEIDIEHGDFIDDHDIAFERIVTVALEGELLGGEFEGAVEGAGALSCRFGESFGGPPCGCGEKDGAILSAGEFADSADDGGFSCAGSACDDGDGVSEGHFDGVDLGGGEGDVVVFLELSEDGIDADVARGRGDIEDFAESMDGTAFAGGEDDEVDGGVVVFKGFKGDLVVGIEISDSLFEGVVWDLEVLFDALEEFAAGDVDVALIAVRFELEQDGGACAKRAICGDSERLGDLVGG